MSFDPKPHTKINLVVGDLAFETIGARRDYIYAEVGKAGTVYKVYKYIHPTDPYALKVFFPDFCKPELMINFEKFKNLTNIKGMRIAKREIIKKVENPIVAQFPDLENAILGERHLVYTGTL